MGPINDDSDFYQELLGSEVIPDTYSSLQRKSRYQNTEQNYYNHDYIYGTYRPHNRDRISKIRNRKYNNLEHQFYNAKSSVQNPDLNLPRNDTYRRLSDTCSDTVKNGYDTYPNRFDLDQFETSVADYSVNTAPNTVGYSTAGIKSEEETDFHTSRNISSEYNTNADYNQGKLNSHESS